MDGVGVLDVVQELDPPRSRWQWLTAAALLLISLGSIGGYEWRKARLISGDPVVAIERLVESQPEGLRTALLWAETASHAALFLAGPLPQDACEELFATAIANANELQRLLDGGGRAMKLDDAHLAQIDYIAKGTAK